MSKRPPIPERYSSLMPGSVKAKLQVIQNRKTSAISALSTCSGVSEFLAQKVEELSQGVEFYDEYIQGLKNSLESGDMTRDVFDEAMSSALEKKKDEVRELVVAKRQRKFIEEDMLEEQGLQQKLEDAYAETMMVRVMLASTRQPKIKFDQRQFRENVEKYYDAVRIQDDTEEVWCCVTGWNLSDTTKAAHIVPKSLQSGELSYLFGVGDALLSEPRNGLMLHRKIEEALDCALVAIVPVSGAQEVHTRWKLVLTDDSKSGRIALHISRGRLSWKDLDGKELEFRGPRRPARRYLYFRYIMTYLICQQRGLSTQWTRKADTKGVMWATPGPYLRKSMLATLARKVSRHFLPEALLDETTFEDQQDSPARPDEDTMAEVLALSIQDTHEKAVEKRNRAEYEDVDDDDDDWVPSP